MKIFISGPIESAEDISRAIRRAAQVAAGLLEAGHSVYVPHLFWFSNIIEPVRIVEYLRNDFEWIEASDAIFRLPGKSVNADAEVKYAKSLCKKVYYKVSEILEEKE